MSETLSARLVTFSGPLGPDALRIPAEPARLTQAAQQLGELADHLDHAGEQLAGTEGRHEDRQGHTTSAVMSVARWNGHRLSKDAGLLRELGEATTHQAQGLRDLQANDLPALRQRWVQAQDHFLAEIHQASAQDAEAQGGHGNGPGTHHNGNGGGHGNANEGANQGANQAQQPPRPALPNPNALLQHLDENLTRPYEGLFRELHGGHASFGGGGGGANGEAAFADARVENAMATYRQTVRSVLEEFADHVQRVRQGDKQLEERAAYPFAPQDEDEGQVAVAFAAGSMVSAVAVLRELAGDLREGARAADEAHDRVAQIGAALQDGRLPSPESGHAGEQGRGFRDDWQRHFQRRTERLRTVGGKVDDVLEKFSRLDEECAAAIRAH